MVRGFNVLINICLAVVLIQSACSYAWFGPRRINSAQNLKSRVLKGQIYASSSEQKAKPKKTNRQSDDSGAAIGFKNVNIAIGSNELINDVNWAILPKERWALVGRNGAGTVRVQHTIDYSLQRNH